MAQSSPMAMHLKPGVSHNAAEQGGGELRMGLHAGVAHLWCFLSWEMLGVLQLEADDFLRAGAEGKVDAAEVEALIQARLQARTDKNWAESDRIRDKLTAMGVVLEDSKGATTWRLAD